MSIKNKGNVNGLLKYFVLNMGLLPSFKNCECFAFWRLSLNTCKPYMHLHAHIHQHRWQKHIKKNIQTHANILLSESIGVI